MSAAPQPIDLLIEPEWLVPIEPAQVVLTGHSLAVHQGRILALPPSREASTRYLPAEHLHLPGQVLIPGFVNLHTHAAMTLLRGFADDLPLMRWLEDHIWPAERRLASPAFVRDGTLLACWEMLRGGITCFNDMYFFPAAAAEAVRQAGMRAVLGITVLEFPCAYATDAEDYLNKGLAVRDACQDEPLLSFALAPHAPYTVADRTFERIATLSAQLDLPVHIHLHETRTEVEESLRQHGQRPLERLRRLGLLGPNLIAVHGVHLDSAEIGHLAESGATLAHCPTSNLKLASGIAPVTEALMAGLRIGLGTDGAASNNRLDILQEMRLAALLAKAAGGDAATMAAHEALRAATLDAATALGLADDIGSLLPGKAADLCAIRLNDWTTQPCYDPVSHLVYVADRENVSHVWVGGRLRIRDGRPVDVNPGDLIDLAGSWHNRASLRRQDRA